MYYYRKLPHILPPHGKLFITYRLAGAIPHEVVKAYRGQYLADEKALYRLYHAAPNFKELLYNLQKKYFAITDRFLDTNVAEPQWLAANDCAKIVYDSLLYLANDEIKIDCFCILPNHVHAVVECCLDYVEVLKRHKSFTANACNRLLQRTGQFWERETYDHVIRHETEWFNIVRFTINNPLHAGLVKDRHDWKWLWVKDDLPETLAKSWGS